MIEHTVKYIIEHQDEFKTCISCNDTNMSKNDHCVGCRDNDFRPIDDEDIYDLEDIYKEQEELIETAFNNGS